MNVLKFCTPKFLTKWHMQNSADPDKTAPEIRSTLFAIPQCILRNKYIKIKIQAKKCGEQTVKIFRTFTILCVNSVV